MIEEQKRSKFLRYYYRHKELCSTRRKQYYTSQAGIAAHREGEARRRQTVKGRFAKYKSQAKSRGIIFSLTLEQFTTYWKKPCNYCGSEILFVGLDRIDNKSGYVDGNVVSCCSWCNAMKSNRTRDEFLHHCQQITIRAGLSNPSDISYS